MASIIDAVKHLEEFGFSRTEAMELVIIEKRKNASKPMTSVTTAKKNVVFSSQTPLVNSTDAFVKSAKVFVPTTKMKTIKSATLFLTAAEKNPNAESYQIEIILQMPKIIIKKRGNYQIEMEVNNDVFTVLEHPT
jgi:hypothetical protein